MKSIRIKTLSSKTHRRDGSVFIADKKLSKEESDDDFKKSLYECLDAMVDKIGQLNERIIELENKNSLFGKLFHSKN